MMANRAGTCKSVDKANETLKPLQIAYQKFKSLLLTDLFKVSFLNGIATVIRMLTGMVSIKVIASIIGPPGIALLGQLNNFSTIILSVSTGGINAGITKYVSENPKDEASYLPILRTSFWVTFCLSIVVSLCLILFAGRFSHVILKSQDYRSVFYIFGATLTMYALNNILLSAINGFRQYKVYVTSNIAGSIVGLVISLVLAYKYGIWGALVSSVTFQSVVFLLTLFMVTRFSWLNLGKIFGRPDLASLRKLSHYSLMAVITAVVMPTGQLIVRSYIKEHESIVSSGIWEGINKISIMYLTVVMTSLSVYFLPKLSELKSNAEVRKEIKKVYSLIMPFLVLSTVVIYLMRGLIIRILFTPEFQGMETLFPFQLAGDIFKMAGWVLGYVMLAKAMTRTYIFMEILSGVFFTGFSLFFISRFGTIGATIGYMVGHMLYFTIMLYNFRGLLWSRERVQP
jgi:O-antigen/teichoic acid export membrane protein